MSYIKIMKISEQACDKTKSIPFPIRQPLTALSDHSSDVPFISAAV